jgi:hypothetical protein
MNKEYNVNREFNWNSSKGMSLWSPLRLKRLMRFAPDLLKPGSRSTKARLYPGTRVI